jgi:hypothetical protein
MLGGNSKMNKLTSDLDAKHVETRGEFLCYNKDSTTYLGQAELKIAIDGDKYDIEVNVSHNTTNPKKRLHLRSIVNRHLQTISEKEEIFVDNEQVYCREISELEGSSYLVKDWRDKMVVQQLKLTFVHEIRGIFKGADIIVKRIAGITKSDIEFLYYGDFGLVLKSYKFQDGDVRSVKIETWNIEGTKEIPKNVDVCVLSNDFGCLQFQVSDHIGECRTKEFSKSTSTVIL